MKLKVNFRVWINCKNKPFLGRGKVVLLKGIMDNKSLSKAAKEIKMSYKAAWDSVHSSNALAQDPLINTHISGKGGGGTKITIEGQKAIETFENLEKLQKLLSQKLQANNLEKLDSKITALTALLESF